MMSTGLPALDCHAHIAPDVTAQQIAALGNAFVFAVTRSLNEAEAVIEREDASLVWGCGVHPGIRAARMEFDDRRFSRLLPHFGFVGEVGLDRRGGDLPRQGEVLRSILAAVSGEPVLISLHSAGCVSQLLEILEADPHPGAILHWFTGDADAIRQAVALGCYFSVNAVMSDDALTKIPLDRILPETDFPATRRRGGGARPGDTAVLEDRLGRLVGLSADEVRLRWYLNLRTISAASGAIDRLPKQLIETLVPI